MNNRRRYPDGNKKVSAAAVILICILLCCAVGAVTVFALLYKESENSEQTGVVQEAIMEAESYIQNNSEETAAERPAAAKADSSSMEDPGAPGKNTGGSTASAEGADGQDSSETAEEKTAAVRPDKVVFVGDSRTVQMEMAVDYDSSVFSFIGESGMGYDWFAGTAVYRTEGKLGPYHTAVIINMGVNDLGNVKRYAQLVNRKAAEWKLRGASVFYASVNPVNDGYPTVSNAQIRDFNDTLRSLLSEDVVWIDTYSYMMNNGYTATDGLHYDINTYKGLYSYYLSVLGL